LGPLAARRAAADSLKGGTEDDALSFLAKKTALGSSVFFLKRMGSSDVT